MRPDAAIVPGPSAPAEDVLSARPVSESLHPSREVRRVACVQVPMDGGENVRYRPPFFAR